MKSSETVNYDERYSGGEYIFGTDPNDFLVSVAGNIKPNGNVLSLCEGEGRNATFLAENGFQITAIDGSKVGLAKAKKLAASKNVKFEISVADLADYRFETAKWDAIVLIFGHFPAELREKVHAGITRGLKKGGVYILEAYAPEQIKYGTGGPKDITKLYDLEKVKRELEGLNFEIARNVVRNIREGEAHDGQSAVVQILARK